MLKRPLRNLDSRISEAQIEAALVSNLSYLSYILRLDKPVTLIAKQLILSNSQNRVDLLLSCGNKICLVELKVVSYQEAWLNQVIAYRDEIKTLQFQQKLLSGDVDCYLLVCGKITESQINQCKSESVALISYDTIEVLKHYFNNVCGFASFLTKKPNDYGVFNFGLINRTLLVVSKGFAKESDITKNCKLSQRSVHNHLKFASEFGLVRKRNGLHFLTDFGHSFIESANEETRLSILSPNQKVLLKNFITKDPFYSATVYGVFCLLESAIILSKTSYPIDLENLQILFRTVAGKSAEWKAKRTLSTATYSFLNFAIDLDILSKSGKQIVITPDGFSFILMLELHKSLKMVEGITGNAKFD